MGIVFNRITSAILAGIFLLSTIMTGTFGWHSLSQTALNERLDVSEPQDVQLIKLEKDADPEKPLAGAVFYLFNADGEQIGSRYITDAEGKIHVELPLGDYYFEEQLPPLGYTFDQEDGAAKTRYPVTVIPGQEETVVRAYNVPLTGSLTVQKLVENADKTPLTDEQKELAFTFTVTFSDSGTYTCRVDGEGEPISFASGGQILLRHEQTAVFEDIPVGVLYTVTETPLPGYAVSATGHRGNICEEGNAAVFVNTYTPDVTGSLTVTKEVKGEGADLNKEFTFTAVIDGETVTFPLKHGEEKVFSDLPIGTEYTITETDDSDEGYIAFIREYTGVITGQDTVLLPFVNVYNPDLDETGDLTIEKEVIGEGADPNKEFTFEITFEGEGAPESPQIFKLKNGESKIFTDIPVDVVYTVRETDAGGYVPEQIVTTGTVTAETPNLVIFRNHVPEEPSSVKLSVTKALAGEYPAADEDKAFSFTLIIDGGEHQFVLKPGETKEFELPPGAQYEVIEADYLADGYICSVTNGFGIAVKEPIEIVVTNTFIGNPEIEIGGVKKWVLGDSTDVTLPESITVLLKHGEIIVEEKTVTPDNDGNWKYTFTASKYDADGNEIAYTVEELPVDGFKTVYNGYDITNEYLTPVFCDSPVIIKYVGGENIPETVFAFTMRAQNGAPMPEGSADGVKTMYITGSGEVKSGIINFTKPGVYTYIIAEQNSGEAGWTYDTTRYTLTVTVVEEVGKLVVAERKLEKNGEAAEAVEFTNTYTEPPASTVTVQGQKIWQHGTNPAENHPESIVVHVYADGEPIRQWQVSAQDNWSYSFELPKYAADGQEIVYTIDEEDVDGYTKQIEGYNLINTYTEPPANTVTVQGQKIWQHGTNPAENHPESIVVYVYADGELIRQWQVSAQDNWRYSFELPKYAADGQEIVYTIDEKDVDGYTKQIDGYNLINTYVEPPVSPPDDPTTPPVDPDDPSPDSPQTGDNSNLSFWFTLMILSLIGLITTIRLGYAYVGKHSKRSGRGR